VKNSRNMAGFSRLSAAAQRWQLGDVLAATLATGCSRGAAATPARQDIRPSYDNAGRLEQITYDRNHDGKPDAWLKMRGAQVISADLDEDFDGIVDRREFYVDGPVSNSGVTSASTLPARTELLRAEQSTRGDGKMNRVEFYEHGKLARVEEDTNADKWETWSGGSLVTLALDSKGTGRPDRRIVYSADGAEPRMEVDVKGDGTFTPLSR
jgi:hypothetical protein